MRWLRSALAALGVVLALATFTSAQTLNWNYDGTIAISGFRIYRALTSGTPPVCGTFALIGATADGILTYRDTDPALQPGQVYCYRVTAYNAEAESPPSNTATSTESYKSAAVLVTGAGFGGGPLVEVFSGTGSLLRSFFAYYPTFTGGVTVAVGDVNGDGIPDIVTAAGPGGGPHVKVFDGATGATIMSFFAYNPAFTGGVFVAAGDVNGDGFADVVTGAGAGGGPLVQVFSGRDGTLLRSFFAYEPAFTGGVRVAVGDVNGDGIPDIVTAAGPGGGPHVKIFDEATANIIMSFFAYQCDQATCFRAGVFVGSGQ